MSSYDISLNSYNVNSYNVVDCYYIFMMNIKVSNGQLSKTTLTLN
uniref:Uncharacterized protein n=1 Tax=viral metagenome TaxID=1070528 RepID=A0A6C0CA54_9ZZZZ